MQNPICWEDKDACGGCLRARRPMVKNGTAGFDLFPEKFLGIETNGEINGMGTGKHKKTGQRVPCCALRGSPQRLLGCFSARC